jgi:hypothetical protein
MREHLPEPVRTAARGARRRVRLARRWLHRPDPMPVAPDPGATRVRLLIGPANFAGQGYEWARAVERAYPDVTATAFMLGRDRLAFPADWVVEPAIWGNPWWQRQQTTDVLGGWTHVLAEAVKPVLGTRYGNDVSGEAKRMRRRGVSLGLVAHGSDARLPSRHAASYDWSPFRDADDWEVLPKLEERVARHLKIYADHHERGGAVFVTTPDLLDDLPYATWLPVVIEVDRWRTEAPLLERERPRLLHVPSNPRMKGTALVEPTLHRLHDEGVIEYVPLEAVEPHEMPAHIADVDLVLDQVALGAYGAMAVQAMAAGRVTLVHLDPRNLARLPQAPPVADVTPDTLEDVVRGLVADRDAARALAARGAAYADTWHDGRHSAAVLAPWLGVGAPVPEAVSDGS